MKNPESQADSRMKLSENGLSSILFISMMAFLVFSGLAFAQLGLIVQIENMGSKLQLGLGSRTLANNDSFVSATMEALISQDNSASNLNPLQTSSQFKCPSYAAGGPPQPSGPAPLVSSPVIKYNASTVGNTWLRCLGLPPSAPGTVSYVYDVASTGSFAVNDRYDRFYLSSQPEYIHGPTPPAPPGAPVPPPPGMQVYCSVHTAPGFITPPPLPYTWAAIDARNMPPFTAASIDAVYGVIGLPNFSLPDTYWTQGFLQNGVQVLPAYPPYIEWFGLRCFTRLIVPASGNYQFLALVDDGVRVAIDDSTVLLDHTKPSPYSAEVSQIVSLSAGTHALQVDWWQAPRLQMALTLQWAVIPASGNPHFTTIPSTSLSWDAATYSSPPAFWPPSFW